MPRTKKNKLTPDIIAKLKGVSIVSDTIDFKLEVEDVPEEFTPVFTIKNFSVTNSDKIKEMTDGIDQENEEEMAEFIEELVRQHIVGWKNLYDLSTGEEWEFKADEDGGCDKVLYKFIPAGVRAKILNFITSLTGALK